MKNLLIKIHRFVLVRQIFYKFNLHVYKLALRGIGILNSNSTYASGEEFLLSYLSLNFNIKIVFDVGANEGGYAMLVKKYIQDCEIYAFEPGKLVYNKLKRLNNKNSIKTFNIGLSYTKKSATFYSFNKNTAFSSVYKDVIAGFHKQKAKPTKIKLDTIDNQVKKLKIKNIDFLKIDTEGSELDVIKGASKLIKTNKIKIIHFEFNEMNVYSRIFLLDFIKLLPNYKFFRLMPNGFFPLDNYSPKTHEIFAYQNIVAFRKDLPKF